MFMLTKNRKSFVLKLMLLLLTFVSLVLYIRYDWQREIPLKKQPFVIKDGNVQLRALIDNLQNPCVIYDGSSIQLFHQVSNYEIILYVVLALIFISLGIGLFSMREMSGILFGLLLIMGGGCCMVKASGYIREYNKPKRAFVLNDEGLMQDKNMIFKWKDIKTFNTRVVTMECAGRVVGIREEIDFVNQADEIVFDTALHRHLLSVESNEFLRVAQHFLKVNGVEVGC
jgi:hypothetical protein